MTENKNIIQNSLRLIKQCPVCSTKYTVSRAKIVDITEDGFIIYFSCSNCWSSLLANITEMPFGMVASAMLTDLQLNELEKFKNAEPVNVDDVLEVHKGLRNKE